MQEKFGEINELMGKALSEGVFPSAALLIAKNKEVVFENYYGKCSLNTIFDVASLTKVVVTTTLSMFAVSEGLIHLDDTLDKYFPNCPNLKSIKIFNLLNHSSGLPAWNPYYQEVPHENVGALSGRNQIIEEICNELLEYETGTESVYSDLGFILLGIILESVFFGPLCQLAEELIVSKLGMGKTFYRPVKKTPWSGENFVPAYDIDDDRNFAEFEFAPTEDCPWRGMVMNGYVHDQNSYAMGGVSGHAGLFSTVDDLNLFTRAIVDSLGGKGNFIPSNIVGQFVDPYTSKLAYAHPGSFLLGWDRAEWKNSQAGNSFSEATVGHLGYTGCSLWIDLKGWSWVILLSNRIHPSSMNEKIKAFRPALHDQIWGKLGV